MRRELLDQRAIDAAFAKAPIRAGEHFRQACEARGLAVMEHPHPLPGPGGEALAMQVARLGPAAARRMLVVLSGVHGPELLCGSGIQTALLRGDLLDDLAADTAVLMIHAVNPWGAAHLSRTTEDHVDICRNFVDFSSALPVNDAYQTIRLAFDSSTNTATADAILADFERKYGSFALQRAIWGGQYTDPRGFSFGGSGPTWSRRQLEHVLEKECAGAERIAVVDCHSGVGPYGYGLAVCMHAGEGLARARRWFGGWVIAPREPGNDQYYPVTGHTSDGYERLFPAAEVTAIVLEYGTWPLGDMTKLMRRDHALRFSQDADPKAIRAAREACLAAYFPDDPAWRYAVLTRAAQVIGQAIAGLSAG